MIAGRVKTASKTPEALRDAAVPPGPDGDPVWIDDQMWVGVAVHFWRIVQRMRRLCRTS